MFLTCKGGCSDSWSHLQCVHIMRQVYSGMNDTVQCGQYTINMCYIIISGQSQDKDMVWTTGWIQLTFRY